MFRFFLRLNIIGWLASQALLILYLLILVAPVLVGFGLIAQSEGVPNGTESNILEILSAKGLQAFLKALLYSFCFGLLCSVSGTICGFYTSQRFTGKSILLLPVVFLLVIPEFMNFLVNLPLVGIFVGLKNLSALTYGGSLTWGFVLSLFCAHAYFMRVSSAEMRSSAMLGAGFLENLIHYVLPKSKNIIIYTSLFLTLQFICQGLFTARYAIKPSNTFFFYLQVPGDVFNTHGPGSIAYGFLLISGMLSALVAFRYFQLEFSAAGSGLQPAKVGAKSRKKVTRKKKKKRKQHKKLAVNEVKIPVEEMKISPTEAVELSEEGPLSEGDDQDDKEGSQ